MGARFVLLPAISPASRILVDSNALEKKKRKERKKGERGKKERKSSLKFLNIKLIEAIITLH